MKLTKSVLVKVIVVCLIFALIAPSNANAAVVQPAEPMASYYLDSYNTYICAMGSGQIEIWFTVVGTNYMDEIGTLKIMLYESTDNKNWTWKDTFLHEDCPSMLAYNDYFHSSCVSYQGVAGRYYKAYVCIWAGKNGSGDTRYMWATSVQAT